MNKIIDTMFGKMIGTMAIVLLMGFYAQVSFAQIYDDTTGDESQTTQQQTTDDDVDATDDTDVESSDASTLNNPGVPTTGMGGNSATNLALIVSSLSLAGLGLAMMRKRERTR